MKKILFFPLYAGELGWELMVWQGLLRKAAQNFDEVHGVCFEPFKHLYEDFTDKLYLETPSKKFLTPAHEISTNIEEKINELISQEDTEVSLCNTEMTIGLWNCKEASLYKSYKEDLEKKYDVVLHLRQMDHRPDDNGDPEWNIDLVKKLLSQGKRVALIGTTAGAQDIDLPLVDKFYDKPLSEVIKVINQSKFVVGPSSGPMHLAALCEAEIVVWHHPNNWDVTNISKRYTEDWNPFNNKVNYLTRPSIEDILKVVK